MGIVGLTSLLSNKGIPVNLFEAAKERFLLIDGLAIIFHLLETWLVENKIELQFSFFPSYSLINYLIEGFHNLFKSVSIELVWYFDTNSFKTLQTKLETLKYRSEQRIQIIVELLSLLEDSSTTQKKFPNSLKQSALIFPPLLIIQVINTLLSIGAKVKKCFGEADHELAKDAKDVQVFGIVSKDSDFYLIQGIVYIPAISLNWKSYFLAIIEKDITKSNFDCQYFTAYHTSKLLDLPVDLLPDFGSLVGNDYTTALLARYNVADYLGLNSHKLFKTPMINDVIQFLQNPQNPQVQKLKQLFSAHRDLKKQFDFSRLIYANKYNELEDPTYNIKINSDQTLFEFIKEKMKTGEFPGDLLSIIESGFITEQMVLESIEETIPSANEISERIIGAICLLLGKTNIRRYRRIGIRYKEETIDFSHILKSFPIRFPDKHLNLTSRIDLLCAPIHSFGAFHQFSSSKLNLLFQNKVLPPSLMVSLFCTQYLIASSMEHRDYIEKHEFLALLFMSTFLECLRQELSILKSDTLKFDWKFPDSLPNIREVTISNRYQTILRQFLNLFHCLNLHHFWFPIPAPMFLFDSSLFWKLQRFIFEKGIDEIPISLLRDTLNIYGLKWNSSFGKKFQNMVNTVLLELKEQTLLIFNGTLPSRPPCEVSTKEEEEETEEFEKEETFEFNIIQTDKSGTKTELPIHKQKQQIIKHIQTHNLTVIQGDAGCGKSSQIPQFILEVETNPFIIVTQPRRIAAISLAKRVSHELGEELGNSVGYRIRNDSSSHTHTKVYYVTIGWFLYKILFNPQFFFSCTHIILDEIHERSLEADLLYLYIKNQYLEAQESENQGYPISVPKLVLMSATFDAEFFSKYFFEALGERNIPVPLFVGTHRFPVSEFFIEDLNSHPLLKDHIPHSTNKLRSLALESEISLKTIQILKNLGVSICMELGKHHQSDPSGNCVLVFLPGLQEIDEVRDIIFNELNKNQELKNHFEILILHSSLELEDQILCFAPLSNGITRIILSTNIAESSITIPYVRYIVDFGIHKIINYNFKQKRNILELAHISESSAKQRAGRAGRLFPGTIFRLYSKTFKLEPYDQPEMLRLSLSTTILKLAVLSQYVSSESLLSNPELALQTAIQPPDPYSVQISFEELINFGCVEGKIESPIMTHLGNFLVNLPLSLEQGKLIVYGLLSYTYFPHSILLAASISVGEIFRKPHPAIIKDLETYCNLIATAQEVRKTFVQDCNCEIILSIIIFLEYLKQPSYRRDSWCFNNAISIKKIKEFISTVKQIVQQIFSQTPNQFKPILDCLLEFKYEKINSILPMDFRDIKAMKMLMGFSFPEKLVLYILKSKSNPNYPDSITASIKHVPSELLDKSSFLAALPSIISKSIKEVHFGKKVTTGENILTKFASVDVEFLDPPNSDSAELISFLPTSFYTFKKSFYRNTLRLKSNISQQELELSGFSSNYSSKAYPLSESLQRSQSVSSLVDGLISNQKEARFIGIVGETITLSELTLLNQICVIDMDSLLFFPSITFVGLEEGMEVINVILVNGIEKIPLDVPLPSSLCAQISKLSKKFQSIISLQISDFDQNIAQTFWENWNQILDQLESIESDETENDLNANDLNANENPNDLINFVRQIILENGNQINVSKLHSLVLKKFGKGKKKLKKLLKGMTNNQISKFSPWLKSLPNIFSYQGTTVSLVNQVDSSNKLTENIKLNSTQKTNITQSNENTLIRLLKLIMGALEDRVLSLTELNLKIKEQTGFHLLDILKETYGENISELKFFQACEDTFKVFEKENNFYISLTKSDTLEQSSYSDEEEDKQNKETDNKMNTSFSDIETKNGKNTLSSQHVPIANDNTSSIGSSNNVISQPKFIPAPIQTNTDALSISKSISESIPIETNSMSTQPIFKPVPIANDNTSSIGSSNNVISQPKFTPVPIANDNTSSIGSSNNMISQPKFTPVPIQTNTMFPSQSIFNPISSQTPITNNNSIGMNNQLTSVSFKKESPFFLLVKQFLQASDFPITFNNLSQYIHSKTGLTPRNAIKEYEHRRINLKTWFMEHQDKFKLMNKKSDVYVSLSTHNPSNFFAKTDSGNNINSSELSNNILPQPKFTPVPIANDNTSSIGSSNNAFSQPKFTPVPIANDNTSSIGSSNNMISQPKFTPVPIANDNTSSIGSSNNVISQPKFTPVPIANDNTSSIGSSNNMISQPKFTPVPIQINTMFPSQSIFNPISSQTSITNNNSVGMNNQLTSVSFTKESPLFVFVKECLQTYATKSPMSLGNLAQKIQNHFQIPVKDAIKKYEHSNMSLKKWIKNHLDIFKLKKQYYISLLNPGSSSTMLEEENQLSTDEEIEESNESKNETENMIKRIQMLEQLVETRSKQINFLTDQLYQSEKEHLATISELQAKLERIHQKQK